MSVGCSADVSAPSITIGTGELNTAYNPIGDRLALLLRQKEGGKFYKADSVTTLGSVDNLAGLVKHTYDLAFVAGSELARATDYNPDPRDLTGRNLAAFDCHSNRPTYCPDRYRTIRKRQLKNCARCKDTFALRFARQSQAESSGRPYAFVCRQPNGAKRFSHRKANCCCPRKSDSQVRKKHSN